MKGRELWVAIVLGAAAAAGLAVVVVAHPGLVVFEPFSVGDFVADFAPLLFVALLVERALEVLLTPWRAGPSEAHQAAIRRSRELAKAGTGSAADVLAAEETLLEYRAGTRQLAFIAAVSAGVIVATLGIRALEPFVNAAEFEQLPAWQATTFRVADVVLTATLLSGGADGIHKFVSVFLNYFEMTSNRLKGLG